MDNRVGLTWIVPQLLLLMTSCTQMVDSTTDETSAGLSVPSKVRVDGKVVDVETNYLPRVVQCENPGAPPESMKAQAIAARTWLAHEARGRATPSVADGQSAQAYTCAANKYGAYVSAAAKAAVLATTGKVVTWNGRVTAGFFVAGDTRRATSCRSSGDPTSTERFVTYNFGAVGGAVEPSSIGDRSNPDNRGCMAQNLANCLDEADGYDHAKILRYFYGSDIVIGTAHAAALAGAAAVSQSHADTADGTCYSQTFDRSVPRDACIQVGSGQWYQCDSDGALRTVHADVNGDPVGSPGCFDVSSY